jgi:transposase
MDEKQAVIIGYFREGKSLRQLARETGRSRDVVSKYVKLYAAAKAHLESEQGHGVTELIEDLVAPPKYNSSTRRKRKVTPEMENRVKDLLAENAVKRSLGQHKQQLKKVDIYETLVEEGYDISYPSICNLVRELESPAGESFIKQSYEPGDVCEFDWGEVKLHIGGKLRKIQMAVFTSAAGNHRYGRLFFKQDTASFQQAHVFYFDHVGGVHRQLVYDNMRVAVKRFVGYTEKEATDGLLKLSMYYQFGFRFCNVRRGNEKGHVERSVEVVRRKAFAHLGRFDTLEAANDYLRTICDKLNQKPQTGRNGQSAADILELERPCLLPTPSAPFECGQLCEPKVDKYSTVSIDTCHYSVPEGHVGRKLQVKVYPNRIVCYNGHERLCEHEKRQAANEWILNLDHYLDTLKRKPGALAGSVAFAQAEPRLKRIYRDYYPDNPKDFIELLHYLRDQKKSLGEIETAIKQLSQLSSSTITTDKIKVICDRQPITAKTSVSIGHIELQATAQLASLASLIPDQEAFQNTGVVV